MFFSDRSPGRWRDAWERIDSKDVETLREVMREIAQIRKPRDLLCAEIGINDHDLRNFLSAKRPRPRHWAGLRMLRYAIDDHPGRGHLSSDTQNKIGILKGLATNLYFFEPEEDYFFKHLQRLKVTSETQCRRMCEQMAGSYYSHRLSRRPGYIIRSHYEIMPFTTYNRIPRFINKLKYGGAPGQPRRPDEVKRTSRGQVFPLSDAFIFLGFVFYGYDWRSDIEYDGIQVNIFPRNQFVIEDQKIIDGLFLSFVYNDRYEMGPMKFVRSSTGFDESEVGEFPIDLIKSKEPDLDLSDLTVDISQNTQSLNLDSETKTMLNTCLSFMFGPKGVQQYALKE